MQKITNRDRYPQSEFLPEFKPAYLVDGTVYLLVGYEDGNKEMPLVARNEPELHATPLYELLKFSQGEVSEIGNAEADTLED